MLYVHMYMCTSERHIRIVNTLLICVYSQHICTIVIQDVNIGLVLSNNHSVHWWLLKGESERLFSLQSELIIDDDTTETSAVTCGLNSDQSLRH